METASMVLSLIPSTLFVAALILSVKCGLRNRTLTVPFWVYATGYAAIVPPAVIDMILEPDVEIHRLMAVLSVSTAASALLSILPVKRFYVLLIRLILSPVYWLALSLLFDWSILSDFRQHDLWSMSFHFAYMFGSMGLANGGCTAACFVMHELTAAAVAGRSVVLLAIASLISVRFAMFCFEATGQWFYIGYVGLASISAGTFFWLSIIQRDKNDRSLTTPSASSV
ncbi:MAG: hypothetical protein KDB27_32985 [Planctomycetales bacterium]|nr:hypothetical protein [Planctomycetales bacterium]